MDSLRRSLYLLDKSRTMHSTPNHARMGSNEGRELEPCALHNTPSFQPGGKGLVWVKGISCVIRLLEDMSLATSAFQGILETQLWQLCFWSSGWISTAFEKTRKCGSQCVHAKAIEEMHLQGTQAWCGAGMRAVWPRQRFEEINCGWEVHTWTYQSLRHRNHGSHSLAGWHWEHDDVLFAVLVVASSQPACHVKGCKAAIIGFVFTRVQVSLGSHERGVWVSENILLAVEVVAWRLWWRVFVATCIE